MSETTTLFGEWHGMSAVYGLPIGRLIVSADRIVCRPFFGRRVELHRSDGALLIRGCGIWGGGRFELRLPDRLPVRCRSFMVYRGARMRRVLESYGWIVG